MQKMMILISIAYFKYINKYTIVYGIRSLTQLRYKYKPIKEIIKFEINYNLISNYITQIILYIYNIKC